MHYSQTSYHEEDKAELSLTIAAEAHTHLSNPVSRSPFTDPAFFLQLKKSIALFFVRLAGLLTSTELLVRDVYGPLKQVSPEALKLLSWLGREGYIQKWEMNSLTPGQPLMSYIDIVPNPIRTPEGHRFKFRGSAGDGVAWKLKDAVVPALGEFIERYSVSAEWWKRGDIHTASISELRKVRKVFVDPHDLRFWGGGEKGGNGTRSILTDDMMIHWVKGYDALTHDTVLIPASTAYTFFAAAYQDEPVLGETSSNGAAAHVTYEEAEYRALCELIERDAFLRAWYHQLTPARLDLKRIVQEYPEYHSAFTSIRANKKVVIELLDITSDIGLPTICTVVCNRDPDSWGVSVSAASDLDVGNAIQRSFFEAIKFLHATPPKNSFAKRFDLFRKFQNGTVNSFDDRRGVWSQQEAIGSIEWFLGSKSMISLNDLNEKYRDLSENGNTKHTVLGLLKRNNIGVSFVRFQNKLTLHSGLKVVRAISPDLIPMFFCEHNRPMNFTRFTHREDGSTVQLNNVPHPFI